jgi:hypothetical protein
VIRSEQLSEALDRIDPRDRELLALSLRRRVPDEDLARLYACEPAEVSRRRARAIERLADAMELQRGEDLGAVLKALLEPATWAGREPEVGSEFTSEKSSDAPKVIPVTPEPVLEMLAAREREVPDPPRRSVALALVALALTVLVAAAAVVVALRATDEDSPAAPPPPAAGSPDDGTRHFLPTKRAPLVSPFPTDPKTEACYATASLTRPTVIYREPGGARRMKLAARTEWKSPRVLGVVTQRGAWLGVQAPELRNGELGWIPREAARVDCVRWSLHADLSKRLLFVRRDGVTVRRLRVAVGRPGNDTPRGRFSVTDKLRVRDPASVYGCCVLALSGHQTNLPASWPGGDRLAVHATKDTGSIGKAVSLGCLRADASQARWLINTIPLGAPIFIRS